MLLAKVAQDGPCVKVFWSAWGFDGVTGLYVLDFWDQNWSKVWTLMYILVLFLCSNISCWGCTFGQTNHLTKCAHSSVHGRNNGSKTAKNHVNPSNFQFETLMVWLWVVITKSKLRVTLIYYTSICGKYCDESFMWSQMNVKIHSLKVIIHILKVSKLRVQFGVLELMTETCSCKFIAIAVMEVRPGGQQFLVILYFLYVLEVIS